MRTWAKIDRKKKKQLDDEQEKDLSSSELQQLSYALNK